jgi:hypothetical protein
MEIVFDFVSVQLLTVLYYRDQNVHTRPYSESRICKIPTNILGTENLLQSSHIEIQKSIPNI